MHNFQLLYQVYDKQAAKQNQHPLCVTFTTALTQNCGSSRAATVGTLFITMLHEFESSFSLSGINFQLFPVKFASCFANRFDRVITTHPAEETQQHIGADVGRRHLDCFD